MKSSPHDLYILSETFLPTYLFFFFRDTKNPVINSSCSVGGNNYKKA